MLNARRTSNSRRRLAACHTRMTSQWAITLTSRLMSVLATYLRQSTMVRSSRMITNSILLMAVSQAQPSHAVLLTAQVTHLDHSIRPDSRTVLHQRSTDTRHSRSQLQCSTRNLSNISTPHRRTRYLTRKHRRPASGLFRTLRHGKTSHVSSCPGSTQTIVTVTVIASVRQIGRMRGMSTSLQELLSAIVTGTVTAGKDRSLTAYL